MAVGQNAKEWIWGWGFVEGPADPVFSGFNTIGGDLNGVAPTVSTMHIFCQS